MGRRAAVVSVATLVVAATAALGFPHAEPLPTLRNGADWRTNSALGRARQAAMATYPGAAPAAADAGVADAIAWLHHGTVAGPYRDRRVVEQALLDLHGLTQRNGAVAAGPDGPWAYAWPRDNAFVAVAYAVSGHPQDAWRTLEFFVGTQLVDGGFEARYTLDGVGPPDERQRQTDGAGWLLWAMDHVRVATGQQVPPTLRALRDRAVDYVLHLTDDGLRLPPPSPDYWEVPERKVTLGTVGPLAAGLDAAARSYAAEGDRARSQRAAGAAVALRRVIREHFAPHYQRHGSSGGLDAGILMLLPPFADSADAEAVAAAGTYAEQARRAAGGLAPGVAWKSDGVSWTPETALSAYTAAATGHVDAARGWLAWLAAHRTAWGSVPEKVRPDGLPAGPAPLAWTAALVVLTAHEVGRRA